jgi:arylsulfatase A-like enzyme
MLLPRVLLVLFALAGPGLSSFTVVHAQSALPNIIVIVTDDQDVRSLEQMPNVQQQLVQKGASFSNFLVSTPGCCPSRASILRGQYSHNRMAVMTPSTRWVMRSRRSPPGFKAWATAPP